MKNKIFFLSLPWGAMSLLCGLVSLSCGVRNVGTLCLLAMGLLFLVPWLLRDKLAPGSRARRLYAVLVLGTTSCLTAFLLLLAAAGTTRLPEKEGPVTVIVLGCQITGDSPSLMLRRRLALALEYLEANPQAVCIVSGGQGEGEAFTEARVMEDWLVEQGADPDRIFRESASGNTSQNLLYSYQVAEEEELPTDVILSTDGFHQLRAGIYARRYGFRTVGRLSALTPWGLLPSYCVRELFGLVKAFLFY